ncbi:hypothetical protein RHMOL_Rhmol13G0220800 [Rhododendron molle]|uniref:Uncharacterized protein n=1 Tax=Rhododendron molle TaxID=49168 RepID=A0ACC0LAB7_RHOML|nr:hypothetical protein RHMOL_Rhmol13G0220800 [Rhododendron molle]
MRLKLLFPVEFLQFFRYSKSFTVLLLLFVFRNFLQSFLSGEDSERVLKYNPSTKETTVLVRNLQFPNGVSLSKDGLFFVFCKVVPARLRKYWLKGEKAGTSEVMAILPGFPDNIRTNEKGEFWVAINSRRTMYGYLCSLYPTLRKFLLKLPIPLKFHIGGRPHAVVVKYSPEGKLLTDIGRQSRKSRKSRQRGGGEGREIVDWKRLHALCRGLSIIMWMGRILLSFGLVQYLITCVAHFGGRCCFKEMAFEFLIYPRLSTSLALEAAITTNPDN